ncbi:hypothetical protein AN401_11695 [Zobellella denitrificans]|uniref:Uncharacterized protein n=1 Tax=Zobellella denitrificans TaxID=347534 RepID=A0A291HQ97_9GAMM|nr:hypothetical protein [Zobellella denitrificans]ATG74330.1 hypothetical protein AN401_11060 [Zobellella denitrificans]ATG74434.1 hypothetical protein AN401_11695 [Zobellella denitrificans]
MTRILTLIFMLWAGIAQAKEYEQLLFMPAAQAQSNIRVGVTLYVGRVDRDKILLGRISAFEKDKVVGGRICDAFGVSDSWRCLDEFILLDKWYVRVDDPVLNGEPVPEVEDEDDEDDDLWL